MSEIERMMGQLLSRWARLHIDFYGRSQWVVSDRSAYERTHMPSHTYEAGDLLSALTAAVSDENGVTGA